jgi:sterol-4alpha-carboxylate 3-dehydrogenase (decarboxylating)
MIKCLVTGGSGFLGQHIVNQLLETGKYEVTIFDIRDLGNPKVKTIVGDLRKPEDVDAACEGIEIVFHCATAAPSAEGALNKKLMVDVNVTGTQHIVDACMKKGVKKVVYTSSASVVFDGTPLVMANEDTPYAAKPMDYYTVTKIEGEQVILEAAKEGKIVACALRPSGIFGEGDLIFVPTLVRQSEKGKMKYIIGSGKNMMDFTYVGNVAQAHLLAADALSADSPVNGSAYFITNQDPRPFWTMCGDLLEGIDWPRPSIHLPFMLIMTIAFIFEYIIKPLVGIFKPISSDFTVNRIWIATTHRTFNGARALYDLGYVPKVTMKEALAKTHVAFSHLRKTGTGSDSKKGT